MQAALSVLQHKQVMPAVQFLSCSGWPGKASCSHAGMLATNRVVAVLQAFIEQLVLQKAEATSKAAPTG